MKLPFDAPVWVQELMEEDLTIERLGACHYTSPFENMIQDTGFIPDDERVVAITDKGLIEKFIQHNIAIPSFEKAGPRRKVFFEPGETVSGIVTCGGICPGLNSVIRSIVMMNYYRYNNKRTYGFRYGYAGLVKENGYDVQLLTPEIVETIHTDGGTILGTSRGNQDPVKMVDRLQELDIDVLYAIGGDGTLRGAQQIADEIAKRGLKIAVVGIPKTIDNDISYIDRSFGFETAFSEACDAIYAAHTEAKAHDNGIGIVKVMGRDSGFIAAHATIATNEPNFCLIPEVDFDLEGPNGFLSHLTRRLLKRKHAVIVVAEGAGQKFFAGDKEEYDASGNKKLKDIGLYLKQKISEHLTKHHIPHSIKYIDPSYTIRSRPPTPNDSIFCSQLAQAAVHAGMSGRTNVLVGYYQGNFTYIPIDIATRRRKKIDTNSSLWTSVLETTGQPVSMLNS